MVQISANLLSWKEGIAFKVAQNNIDRNTWQQDEPWPMSSTTPTMELSTHLQCSVADKCEIQKQDFMFIQALGNLPFKEF